MRTLNELISGRAAKDAELAEKYGPDFAEPARIILRLCKHWGHKWPVQYDEQHGRIELPMGTVHLQAGEGRLTARLDAAPDADLDRFEQVVAEHAQRMARGETYVWDWRRQAA